MSRLYPIFADLSDRPVLVVGGGQVAARKVKGLLESGAAVSVVAPQLCAKLEELACRDGADVQRREFAPSDLDGKWLVVAATDDAALNEAICRKAVRRRIFCNAVDQPDACSFHVPAVARRGLLQLAISTGGASPALARRIRQRLEQQFGPAYEPLLEALTDLRRHVQRRYPGSQARRQRALEAFIDSLAEQGPLGELDPQALRRHLERWKSQSSA
ncbi:MAG: precorrin-2 dehydrogenase/sirohydrochlorin ferrochelatase family protein [Planctomycetota bacterium]